MKSTFILAMGVLMLIMAVIGPLLSIFDRNPEFWDITANIAAGVVLAMLGVLALAVKYEYNDEILTMFLFRAMKEIPLDRISDIEAHVFHGSYLIRSPGRKIIVLMPLQKRRMAKFAEHVLLHNPHVRVKL